MICFKDMTFCDFLDCADKLCFRMLTKKVEKEAEKLDLPICKFIDRPDCYTEKNGLTSK